jgi:hypothetical protein
MESFIESYGLPFPAFREIITETHSLVAGSAALALYLQQEGIDPGFVPGDLDIWVRHTIELVSRDGSQHRPANMDSMSLFLIQQGYNLTTKFEPKNNEDYSHLHNIVAILSFVKQGKEIQIIMVNQPNLNIYIHLHFDLSICMTWWDAAENSFKTSIPESTRRKEMHFHPHMDIDARGEARIQKYRDRGFSLMEVPCHALVEQDMRPSVDYLRETTAFDVIAYEDVNAAEFLRQSSYHILLQMGEQLHAFHRNTLCEYLEAHKTHIHPVGDVVDTPHKLSLISDVLSVLPYSDYSVFVLVHAYDFQEKSIYSVRCYTLAGWFVDESVRTIEPPSAEVVFAAVPSSVPHPVPHPNSQLPLYHTTVYWMD